MCNLLQLGVQPRSINPTTTLVLQGDLSGLAMPTSHERLRESLARHSGVARDSIGIVLQLGQHPNNRYFAVTIACFTARKDRQRHT